MSYFFYLFRCVLSSQLPLQSVGRSNFDKGLHNLKTLIQKQHKIIINMKLLYYIYTYIVTFNFLLLFYVVFLINVIKLCKPFSKLDLPTLRKGSREDNDRIINNKTDNERIITLIKKNDIK